LWRAATGFHQSAVSEVSACFKIGEQTREKFLHFFSLLEAFALATGGNLFVVRAFAGIHRIWSR
jgi:hypothetical protein